MHIGTWLDVYQIGNSDSYLLLEERRVINGEYYINRNGYDDIVQNGIRAVYVGGVQWTGDYNETLENFRKDPNPKSKVEIPCHFCNGNGTIYGYLEDKMSKANFLSDEELIEVFSPKDFDPFRAIAVEFLEKQFLIQIALSGGGVFEISPTYLRACNVHNLRPIEVGRILESDGVIFAIDGILSNSFGTLYDESIFLNELAETP